MEVMGMVVSFGGAFFALCVAIGIVRSAVTR